MVTGVLSSYDLTVGVKVNMDEAIYMISPLDLPLLTGEGADGLSVLGQYPVDQRQFDWMDEEALLPRSTLGAAAVTADTYITVASGDQLNFSTGDVVLVASEHLRVTGYGTTADTLLVSRAFAGTAGSLASGAVVLAVGTALAEGSEPENGRSVDRTERYNYTQIYGPHQVQITRTEQGVSKYGVSDELAHQTMLRVREASIAREQSFIYGTRYNSSTTKIRTSGGMDYFITSNVDSTSTQITVSTILSNLETCYNAGGLPDRLLANPKAFTDLNAVTDTAVVRTTRTDDVRGREPVRVVQTEYGDLTMVRNRWIRKADAYAIKREGITRRIFDALIMEKLAKTGDFESYQFVCEEGLEVKGQQHMFKMSGLSYT